MIKPSRINKLTGGSRYTQLLSRAREQIALDKLLHDLVPAPLNEHCRILTISGTSLILAADSPAWAVRLRFLTSRLITQLVRYKPVKIRTVSVRVKPAARPASPNRRQTAPKRTPHGAAALKQAAQTISDPALKSGLLRLASRHTTC